MATQSMKLMGKEVGPASLYAKPHKMDGSALTQGDVGHPVTMPTRTNWTPLNGGVSIGNNGEVKSSGTKTRGNGCATKGTMARGPMA